MKLDVVTKCEHTEIATALTWSPDCQLFTCSDDKLICKWAADGSCTGKINTVTTFITGISWYPATGKQSPDMFAISCSDGTFRFISRSGREEKKVQAHDGAVIVIQWSHDGSALITAGEDGELKLWSKSGNHRANIVSCGQSIFAACWGPDNDQLLIANGKTLMVKTVSAGKTKEKQWSAHDGIILCVDWNIANGLIVSGAEDCTYRTFDSYGRQLYTSRPMEQVVTSVAWRPNGECFAVGSYNMIRLCDKTGWTHSRERLTTGSVMKIAWTSDGTQLAGTCSDGSVLFGQVVNRKLEWKNFEVTLVDSRKIRVQDTSNETLEDIDFARDRVVEMGLGFDHLIATTTTQCYVYSLQNLNTPIIFDIRAPSHFIHLCRNHFLTLDIISGLQIISYEGKVLSTPRFQGLRPEYLTKDIVALAPDCVAVVDTVDPKNIHILDTLNSKVISKITHSAEIIGLSMNQHTMGLHERLLVFVDKNRDFFINSISQTNSSFKLHSHVESFSFNDETDSIVGFADGRLNTWHCPIVTYVDKDLLGATTSSIDASEFGRSANIISYTGNRVSIRKVDGSILYAATPVDTSLLYELVRAGKWQECVRLCRHQRTNTLWGILATLALAKKKLEIAEISLCELNEFTKVEFIQYIQTIPSEEGRSAEMHLFRKLPDEAERILLTANPPLSYRAIKMNILLYRWDRALKLATKYKAHIDTVLGYRQQYLEDFEKKENLQSFIDAAGKVTVDWESIRAKEQQELDEEKRRNGRK